MNNKDGLKFVKKNFEEKLIRFGEKRSAALLKFLKWYHWNRSAVIYSY